MVVNIVLLKISGLTSFSPYAVGVLAAWYNKLWVYIKNIGFMNDPEIQIIAYVVSEYVPNIVFYNNIIIIYY